jgi:hypothetical protein
MRSFLVGILKDAVEEALFHKPAFHVQSCQPQFASMSTLKKVASIHSVEPKSSPDCESSINSIPQPSSRYQ